MNHARLVAQFVPLHAHIEPVRLELVELGRKELGLANDRLFTILILDEPVLRVVELEVERVQIRQLLVLVPNAIRMNGIFKVTLQMVPVVARREHDVYPAEVRIPVVAENVAIPVPVDAEHVALRVILDVGPGAQRIPGRGREKSPVALSTLMKWQSILDFLKIKVPIEPHQVLNVAMVVLHLAVMETFHAESDSKLCLIQVQLFRVVVDVLLEELRNVWIVSVLELNQL